MAVFFRRLSLIPSLLDLWALAGVLFYNFEANQSYFGKTDSWDRVCCNCVFLRLKIWHFSLKVTLSEPLTKGSY